MISNSERMKENNPMFNKKSKEKRLKTIREKHPEWGNFNIGRKRPDLTKRNLENNPLKDSKKREEVNKKGIETRRKLFKEGKLKVWNDGMSKEEFLSYMPKDFIEKIVNATQTEESIKKRNKSVNDKWMDGEFRKKRREKILRGKNHPRFGKHCTKEQIEKGLNTMKERGQLKISSERMRNGGAFKAMSGNKRVSKPEIILKGIIEKNNLQFNHVGKGQIVFFGDNHSFNPDFLSKNPKHIIEVFGNYWHNLPERKILDRERLKTYSKYGYKTLVIWEDELIGKNKLSITEILNKINNFLEVK